MKKLLASSMTILLGTVLAVCGNNSNNDAKTQT